ncbi:MAG TPA: hypothetical protein VFV50_13460 [Bdellovibrionales bacterium]|nr:hypothetical protein [Bdellovibrionales bacterium]
MRSSIFFAIVPMIMALLLLPAVAQAFAVNCGQRAFNYANGPNMIAANGTFYYPLGTVLMNTSGTIYFGSGSVFRSSDDVLYYPTGNVLKTSDGVVNHAMGTVARNASGELFNTDGTPRSQPLLINVPLSPQLTAVVKVAAGSKSSDLTIELSGEAGQTVSLNVTPAGAECPELALGQEVSLMHRAAHVTLKVRPGFSPDRVREAVQQALDKIPESTATPAPGR